MATRRPKQRNREYDSTVLTVKTREWAIEFIDCVAQATLPDDFKAREGVVTDAIALGGVLMMQSKFGDKWQEALNAVITKMVKGEPLREYDEKPEPIAIYPTIPLRLTNAFGRHPGASKLVPPAQLAKVVVHHGSIHEMDTHPDAKPASKPRPPRKPKAKVEPMPAAEPESTSTEMALATGHPS